MSVNMYLSISVLGFISRLGFIDGSFEPRLNLTPSRVKEGYEIRLNCTTQMITPYVVEFHRNDSLYLRLFIRNSLPVSLSYAPPSVSTNCTVSTSMQQYVCLIGNLSRYNHTDNWKCQHNNVWSNIQTVNVTVPIRNAVITTNVTDVKSLREKEPLYLTCEASNGIPPANTSWFLVNKTTPSHYLDVSEYASVREHNFSDKTVTVVSDIKYNVNKEDNEMFIYCVASNIAGITFSSRKVFLDVKYKPQTSILINDQKEDIPFYVIRNSQTRQSLECRVNGGNPLAVLSWSCYDGNQTDNNTVVSAISTVMWNATDVNDSICTCNASHILGWSSQRVVNIIVHYEPSPPNCTIGNANVFNGTINVTLNSDVNITCASNGNPPPNKFTWIWPTQETANQTLLLKNVQITQAAKYTFSVENTMTPSIGNEVTGRSNTTLDIVLQYGPRTPIQCGINGTNVTSRNISVIRGEHISIGCFADAYPPPTYVWSHSSKEGQNTSIAFDNDTTISCNISNVLYPTGLNRIIESEHVELNIEVLYSPKVPIHRFYTCNETIGPLNDVHALVGKPFRAKCSADGNPQPVCTWNSTNFSEIGIANVTKKDSTTYSCNAWNLMNTSYETSLYGLNVSSFHLDVLYPPKITNSMINLVTVEGRNFSIDCIVSQGNPADTGFLWKRTGYASIESVEHVIDFPNISRLDQGNFTCFASNKMSPTGCAEIEGIDTQQFNVDVQFKATIKRFASIELMNQREDLSFECEVESNPPASISILSTNGTPLLSIHGNNRLRYSKISSCLEDSGNYCCISSNVHNGGSPEKRNITVDIKCSPMYRPSNLPQTDVKSKVGEQTMLQISIFSNPLPTTVIWTNLSDNMQLPIYTNESDRVFINTSNNNLSSVVILKSTEIWDFGLYSVRVENVIGNITETFSITLISNDTSTSTDQSFITVISTNNIGAVVGGSVGTISGVVIVAVVVITIFYRRVQRLKGTLPRGTRESHLLENTCHESGKMDMECFGNALPNNDETQKYEEEKNIYGNIQTKDALGKSLTIRTLRDTVQQIKLNPLPLFKEFYTLHIGLQYGTEEALKPNNVAKNRYRSVYPYDASRVVLPFLRGDLDSDFINASYIDGYCKPRKYIAAQGPLENTINDTWRMIYSEDVKIIVMVTNLIETGKRKCFKYWPEDRATYGKCNVKLDKVEEYADFVVRHLTYSMEGTKFERQLIQFHYTSWPDKNVPATALSLVQFWRKVRQSEFVDKTPWMVHCSAGVGRTGTFIALDYLYDQGKVDGKLNVRETVNVLREQRISMVQTKEQYLYLHEAITELLDPVGQIFTPENSLRLRSTATEERKLNKEFEAITSSMVSVKSDFEENDFDAKRMPDGLLPENICKSIDKTVIPDDLFRPLISSGNDFINAVFIPTYRDAEKYIVTQYPLQNTVLDFVRLLWDHSIEDVVLLDVGDEKLHCYWPQNKSPLCIGPFVISLLSVDEGKYCTIRKIDISLAERRQNKQTVVHQFTAWPGYLNLCETKTLTEFLQTISKITGPVVVQCHDGYSRSGLFAALLSIVDRIKTDKEVAIADTVRVVKHRRQAAITHMEQYQFCHEVVFEYLKGRENPTEEKENQEYVNMTFPKFL